MQIYDYNIDYKLPLPSQVRYAFCSRLGNRNGCLLVRISFLLPANEVWGKVIFLHLFVILFTEGEVPDPPGPGTPPRNQVHPLEQTDPPGTRFTPGDQVHPLPGADTPLGPGTPPRTRNTPQDQVHPLDQVHPPRTRYTPQCRACWEIWSTCRRYASYWNAILL